MNKLFRDSKRSCQRATGILLLALPLSVSAPQLPVAQAQPALTPPTPKTFKPLPPEQKAQVQKLLALSRQENICKSLLDLKMQNATLQEVATRIKGMLQGQAVAIEVRGASPVRLGFELKQVAVGDVLSHVAALAGCKLFVLSSGLLLTPSSQLTEAERLDMEQRRGGEWSKSSASGGYGWSARNEQSTFFTRAIAQEATGSDAKPLPATVVKTTFGSFSPESQIMLQEMVSWMNEEDRITHPKVAPLYLNAASPVTVDTSNPRGISVLFGRGESDAGGMALGYADITIPAGNHP